MLRRAGHLPLHRSEPHSLEGLPLADPQPDERLVDSGTPHSDTSATNHRRWHERERRLGKATSRRTGEHLRPLDVDDNGRTGGTSDAALLTNERRVMVGIVTTRHLFTRSGSIVREFGPTCLFRCYWRSLTADHAATFLECAVSGKWHRDRNRETELIGGALWSPDSAPEPGPWSPRILLLRLP